MGAIEMTFISMMGVHREREREREREMLNRAIELTGALAPLSSLVI
jgi:hypothetical protein